MRPVPVVSLVGWSNTGKTTLLEKIISELKGRGYRVGTVKYHHKDIHVDQPGKDSYRHSQAGAEAVVIASPQKFALVRQTVKEWPLEKLLQLLTDMDIIITEGFKNEPTLKIEMYRHGVSPGPAVTDPKLLIAVVSDIDLQNRGVPIFNWNDHQGVADFIEHRFLR